MLQSQVNGHFEFTIDAEKVYLFNERQSEQFAVILSSCLKQAVTVNITAGKNPGLTPSQFAEERAAAAKQKALSALRGDANVQDILQTFDAEIIESSVQSKDS